MPTSRQQILEYVRAHKAVLAKEISQALKMTSANVRHHLSILESEGLVEKIGHRPAAGRGRPAQLYGLSGRAVGDNYDRLASALLSLYVVSLPGVDKTNALKAIAERLIYSDSQGNQTQGHNLSQRLYRAITKLNEMNYQARWEAHAESPHLILGRCPYMTILPTHPELCQLDQVVLEKLVGRPVFQSAKLAVDDRGARYCLFTMSLSDF